MSFLRPLESFIGMFQCLFGMFMSGLVIFLPVVRGGSTVRVCGEFVELGRSLVRVIWHSVSYPRGDHSILELSLFPNCSILDIRAA
jgi:hypothetical protein